MADLADFGIVWQPYSGQSPTGRSLAGTKAFPFFLAGDDLRMMESRQPVRVDPVKLLYGILVASRDEPFGAEPAGRDEFQEALTDLVAIIRAPSLEVLLLDSAANLRNRHGDRVSRTALLTASWILPQSAMIRSDLLMCDWTLLSSDSGPERVELLNHIAAEYPRLELSAIDSNAAETLVYAELVALSLLGRLADRDRVARTDALQYIRRPGVAQRVKYLLEEPNPELQRLL